MLATVMAACSHEEQPQLPEESSAPKTYTMTIEATKGSDTRALGLVDNKLYAAWKKGEKVKVLVLMGATTQTPYFMEIGVLTAQGDGLKTVLKGTVNMTPQEVAAISPNICFLFPFSVNSTFDIEYPFNYTGQIGTLASIAEHFDYSFAFDSPNNYKLVGDEIVINDEAVSDPTSYQISSHNTQAIVRFNLMNQNGDPIYATSLTVHDSATNGIIRRCDYLTKTEYGDIEIVPGNPSSEIWAAIWKQSSPSSITLTATDVDNNTYTFTQDNVVWYSGQYYTVNVKMKQRHQVIINPSEHGTVTVSPSEYYYMGDKNVTLTIHPDDLYVLDELILTFNNSDIPATSMVSNNTVVLPDMPDGDVYVTATFKESTN